MNAFKIAFRFTKLFVGTTVLSWAVCAPAIGLSLFFPFRATAALLAAIAFLSAGLVFLLPEWGVLRLLKGQLPRTYGLRNSYELAYEESGVTLKSRPALVTFSDPVPNVFVVRGFGGSGMILLSEGFISILDEGELRFVLKKAIRHIDRSGTVLQSAAIFVLMLLRRRVRFRPQGLLPRYALRSLFLLPWIRFFSSLTRRVERDEGDEDFVRGASKLSRTERLYGQRAILPGLVYLGVER